MADFESFSGFDAQGDAMDPGAFERFKERMKAAAAQLKAQQAGEQKQKKTEDELVRILLKFIQSGQQHDIMLLVLRLLEENVPAFFIVGILLISNPMIQQELGLSMLPAPRENPSPSNSQNIQPVIEAEQEQPQTQLKTLEDQQNSQNQLMKREFSEESLPLHIKQAIDNWLRHIYTKSAENPHKILKTACDENGLKLTVIQLGTFCLRDFLQQQKIEAEYEKLKDFITLTLGGIINKLSESIKDQKELEEGHI